MPYTKAHKLNIREKIVQNAANEFRQKGIKEVSVPQIMKGAGLTHGGFYAHFANKDQLVAEACRKAIEETINLLQGATVRKEEAAKLQTVIDYYLSTTHRDQREISCILPTLSSEISRSSEEIREAFTLEVTRFFSFIAGMIGKNNEKSMAIVSSMVGALLLARSVNDPELSQNILEASKRYAKEMAALQ
ncbi:TetR/AcrR family transcriptional regulator [Paenibacillus glycanilyticus]|uniref:TetR family transcriptional regulator n=1 Tax=Paenibacillus glycanilyticus TaxID=126569 RepID=A0ABQ6NRZ7_9BACL|nr:TetR/AcrR family transcriptional regulator [Paenibacillus glycanilyticus]GMK47861.1 TetR family transcriptional regulator [Paenibacillus glycanilyticus]